MAHAHDAASHASPDDEYVNPSVAGHEHSDADVRLIVRFAVWLVAATVATQLLMWAMFALFADRFEATTEPEFPLAISQERRLPAGPRLQPFPANEIYEFRQREKAALEGYGWVDRNAGTVRIPIAEAMRLTVERGLPVRVQPAPDAARPGSDPGLMPADSSSGRTMERRR
jgi:hypothetical protein